jgi:hypothetical protein
MAWLRNLWINVSGQSADELTLVSGLRVPGATHEGEPIREDHGEKPELKQQYASLVAAMRSNSPDLLQEALCSFRLAVLTSPELIPSDAERLVAKATNRANRALTRSHTAGSSCAASVSEELADLDLYDEYR